MLRPATPLTILLLGALALLVISIISTPIVKTIPLASFAGIEFGVFGFCKGTDCSPVEIGYDTSNLFDDEQSSTFDLPSSTRASLSTILIVHPIAAFLTLVMLVLAASAHFHSPSHSPRYLLGIFILSILTLVASLLSFLIDVLLFVPHMSWGSYLVLAATILIAASGIVSCAMRRTLVSRKARKRRIAENAEMNGENYYNRKGSSPTKTNAAGSVVAIGALGVDKPSFAVFEMSKQDPDRTTDEQIPLKERMATEATSTVAQFPSGIKDSYGSEVMGDPTTRDQYRNLVPRGGPFAQQNSPDTSFGRRFTDNLGNERGRGRVPAHGGGRAGYLRGYDGRGRGGYAPPRGGHGAPMGAYGPPRAGYLGPYRGDPMMQGRGRSGAPPPGYGVMPQRSQDIRGPQPANFYDSDARDLTTDQPVHDDYAAPALKTKYAAYHPDDARSSLPIAESPPPLSTLNLPIAHAIDMDATTGSYQHPPRIFDGYNGLKHGDGDGVGMVGSQEQKLHRDTFASASSHYSTDESYQPPRETWREKDYSRPFNPIAEADVGASPTLLGGHYHKNTDARFERPSAMKATLAPKPIPIPINTGIEGNYSLEDLAPGARSPAESDRSTFTSVSQRGINPRWNGGGGYGGPMPARRPVLQSDDFLLHGNPDFELPIGRGGRGMPSRGRMRLSTSQAGPYPEANTMS